MNRAGVALMLAGIVFLVGFVVSGRSIEVSRTASAWQPSVSPTPSNVPESLERLSHSPRWQVDPEKSEVAVVTGEFRKDYRLLAVVTGEASYALLNPVHKSGSSMFRIVVGDELENQWMIKEISETSVVAVRDGEKQSVELFPVK